MNPDEIERRAIEMESRDLRCPDCHEVPCDCLARDELTDDLLTEVIDAVETQAMDFPPDDLVHAEVRFLKELRDRRASFAATESRDE